MFWMLIATSCTTFQVLNVFYILKCIKKLYMPSKITLYNLTVLFSDIGLYYNEIVANALYVNI